MKIIKLFSMYKKYVKQKFRKMNMGVMENHIEMCKNIWNGTSTNIDVTWRMVPHQMR